MLNQFIFVYIADILIFSRNQEEHVPHVSFLGFINEQGQLREDMGMISTLTGWPTTTSQKQQQ